jgi:hypothetical protein
VSKTLADWYEGPEIPAAGKVLFETYMEQEYGRMTSQAWEDLHIDSQLQWCQMAQMAVEAYRKAKAE